LSHYGDSAKELLRAVAGMIAVAEVDIEQWSHLSDTLRTVNDETPADTLRDEEDAE
jgi:hypothetical protein